MKQESKSPDLMKTSLSEQLNKILLDKISNLEYPVGSRIDIEKLKRKYGVSHIPIRDALHKLAEQGLVEIVPRIGYFTAKFSEDQIRDLINVRMLLELDSISKNGKNLDIELLKKLEAEFLEYKKKPKSADQDVQHFFTLSESLHKDVIVRNSASPLISSIYAGLLVKIRISSRMVYRPLEDIDEHLGIIQALLKGNRAAAKSCLRKHLLAVKKRILTELQGKDN